MALDRNHCDIFYLTGRYIAIVEKSNNKKMTGTQMDNLFRNPSLYMNQYDSNHSSFTKEREEILSKLPAAGFPKRVNAEESSKMWVGYHHQRAELPDVVVEKHEARKVESFSDNIIEELKK